MKTRARSAGADDRAAADPQAELREGLTGTPPPQADFRSQQGLTWKWGTSHIRSLCRCCRLVGLLERESFEPEQEHKKGDKDSQRHPQLARLSSTLMIETCNISPNSEIH